jgi:hypothetical protein
MKINEIIATVLENTTTLGGGKYTQVMLAEALTEKYGKNVSPAALSDRFKNENMKVNTAIEMLDILGYDIVVVPREKGRDKYEVELGGKRER